MVVQYSQHEAAFCLYRDAGANVGVCGGACVLFASVELLVQGCHPRSPASVYVKTT